MGYLLRKRKYDPGRIANLYLLKTNILMNILNHGQIGSWFFTLQN